MNSIVIIVSSCLLRNEVVALGSYHFICKWKSLGPLFHVIEFSGIPRPSRLNVQKLPFKNFHFNGKEMKGRLK